MRYYDIRKIGGMSLIIGGILLAVYVALFNTVLPVEMMERDFSRMVQAPAWIPVCAVALVAIVLLIFGFTAVYSSLFKESGTFGLFGYVLLTTAYILQAGQLVMEVFYFPAFASTENGIEIFRQDILINHPVAQVFTYLFILFVGLGVLLFGITIFRSNVYSKISPVLFITGALLYAASPIFFLGLAGIILFAAGCFLIGVRVWRIA